MSQQVCEGPHSRVAIGRILGSFVSNILPRYAVSSPEEVDDIKSSLPQRADEPFAPNLSVKLIIGLACVTDPEGTFSDPLYHLDISQAHRGKHLPSQYSDVKIHVLMSLYFQYCGQRRAAQLHSYAAYRYVKFLMKDEWTVDTHLSVIVSLWALVFMQLDHAVSYRDHIRKLCRRLPMLQRTEAPTWFSEATWANFNARAVYARSCKNHLSPDPAVRVEILENSLGDDFWALTKVSSAVRRGDFLWKAPYFSENGGILCDESLPFKAAAAYVAIAQKLTEPERRALIFEEKIHVLVMSEIWKYEFMEPSVLESIQNTTLEFLPKIITVHD